MSAPASLPLARPPDNLCMLRLSAIGDVINAVPIMRTLQQHWPDTALTWLIGRNEADLVGDLPGVEFIAYDKAGSWASLRGLRRRLAGRRFDVFMHMQFALRANMVSACVPSDLRLGYDRARSREGHGLFINRRIGTPSSPHMVDVYFAFLEALGNHDRVLDWRLPVADSEREAIRGLLPDDADYLVVSPCASNRYKDWTAAGYAAVADVAALRYGQTIVLSGGPSERERAMADAVMTHMRAPAIDLVGKTSLKGMLALLERASLLLSPDSGPAHMATATATDVLGLLATSDGRRTGPYRSLAWCVDRFDAAARKLLGRPADDLPWGTKLERPGAMDLISVDDVLERLDAWHAARPRAC